MNDSSDTYKVVAAVAAAIVGTLAVIGLLYGMFVYNHTQDVNRDKFLIEHCGQVTQTTSELSSGKVFNCGAQKK